nr:MAG TPA: hypothetical protein [Caudoviricetes sp.]
MKYLKVGYCARKKSKINLTSSFMLCTIKLYR